jgi:hypothetical protein
VIGYLCTFGVWLPDVLVEATVKPPEMGSRLKSANLAGFFSEVKTGIFTPTCNTTQEPQTEIEALSTCAVHPRNPQRRTYPNIQANKGGVIFAFYCSAGSLFQQRRWLLIGSSFHVFLV